MSEIFTNILTQIGQQKKAQAEVTGTALGITTFKVGDSNGSYYQPNENQTALVNAKYTGSFEEGTQSQIVINASATNEVLYKCFIPADVGGFTIRELGLFDSDGDLILICKLPAQDKFSLASGLYQPLTFTPKIIYTNPQTQAVLTPTSQTVPTTGEVVNIVETSIQEAVGNIEYIAPLVKNDDIISIQIDETLTVEEGKLKALQPKTNMPFAMNFGNLDASGNPDILYAPGSGNITDYISSPRMTTTPLNGFVAEGHRTYFDQYTGEIYSGQTGTLIFPEKMTVTGFTVAAPSINEYYIATSATVYFYENTTLVGQISYNPRASKGATINLPSELPNINKVVHSYGGGSSWGAGQACYGISVNGYIIRSVSTAKELYFKVGGSNPLLELTYADKTSEILQSITKLSNLTINGDFTVIKEKENSTLLNILSSKITQGKVFPPAPAEGDYFCYKAFSPKTFKRINNAWVETQFVIIGSYTAASNVIVSVKTSPFNQNGYDVNFQTQGYRMPDYDRVIYVTGCNTPKQVSEDSFVSIWGTDPYTETWGAYVGKTASGPWRQVGYRYDDVNGSTQGTSFTFLVPKDYYFYGSAENNTYANVFPMKGV
ncbi:MAG: phage tail protein [bacterium]